MQSITIDYKYLGKQLAVNKTEAFRHHNKIMKELKAYGFKSNPEQTVFPHNDLLDTKAVINLQLLQNY